MARKGTGAEGAGTEGSGTAPPTTPPPDLGTNTGGTEVGKGKGNGARVTKNNPEARRAIERGMRKIQELEGRRTEINADIKAERERLVALGLNKQALKDVERLWKMTEEQREGYDETQGVARQALGLPVQPELFPAEPGPPVTH